MPAEVIRSQSIYVREDVRHREFEAGHQVGFQRAINPHELRAFYWPVDVNRLFQTITFNPSTDLL